MPQIGNIQLGGNEGSPFKSSVVFFMDVPAESDRLMQSEDGDWEVETKRNQIAIVARYRGVMKKEEVLRVGYEEVQRALDIIAFESNWCASVPSPGDLHVLLFIHSEKVVLRITGVILRGIRAHFEITSYDRHGNIIREPRRPPSQWQQPLRYYRLSQTAKDLWDAYRNLFLGLESMLEIICSKPNRREKEWQWFLRAFETVSEKVDLAQFVPSGTTNPAEYLVNLHYRDIRCRLFHGKGELPATHEGTLNPQYVGSAYNSLISLWRSIADRYLSIRRQSQGAMTYQGFLNYAGESAQEMEIRYTEDPSPSDPYDTAVSPKGLPVQSFESVNYLGEVSPGEVAFLASQSLESELEYAVIRRICTLERGTLSESFMVPDGLHPEGADVLEFFMTRRMDDGSQPKTFASDNIC